MSDYKNWGHPRTRKRVEQALNWCDFNLSPYRPREAPKVILDRVFGPSGGKLSRALRNELLIEYQSSYMVGQFSKRYLLNAAGVAKIKAAVEHDGTCVPHCLCSAVPSSPMTYYEKRHGQELSALTFKMKDSSNRLWHPLQNIAREKKAEFWSHFGLPFDYDITACAPTILFQSAAQAGLSEIVLGTIRGYLDDRSAFRVHIAALTGLSLDDSKRLINSLFNGARLSRSNHCAAYRALVENEARHQLDADADAEQRDLSSHATAAKMHALRRDQAVLAAASSRMEALQADRQVTKFRREIKFVWDRLELMARHAQIPSFATFMAGQAKPFERKLKSSSQKWGYYFERERQVLDVIRDYLINASTRFFTEHDGFRTSREVDLMELRDVILTKTGLKLVIKRADTTTSNVEHKCWVKTFDADVATTTTAIVQR